jgi:hypothetical protein
MKNADPLLSVVGAIRDLVAQTVKGATWAQALALLFGFTLSWKIQEETFLVRALGLAGALTIGACLGKLLDRKLFKNR